MFGKLLENLISIKTNYLKRSPKEKWLFIRDAGILVLKTTGVPVLDPNYDIYWYSYAAGFVIFDVTISFIYSVWYYKDKDPIRGLLNIPLYFGVLVPVKPIFTFTNINLLILMKLNAILLMFCKSFSLVSATHM